MYDRNMVELVGTIAEEPKFKKTENLGRSKLDLVLKVRRNSQNQTYDRIYCTVWEDLAEKVRDTYHENDRIFIRGRINVSSYRKQEMMQFYTRVVADEVTDVPEEIKGYGVIVYDDTTEQADV